MINWDKVINTLFFLSGAYVRAEKVFYPRTLSLVSFILMIIYMTWKIAS
tara:strand:+ start:2855 stop:3001 length:147 start_codon:yes stop_codon:yes gene_type:complete